jgi:hypothetical protein
VLELVAVVEHAGGVLSDDAPSPFWKPEYAAEMAGGVPPWVNEPLDAVTVSGVASTMAVPGAYVTVNPGSEAPEHVFAAV